MMGAIQRIEDLEEKKRKKIQKTSSEDIDEVKAKYCCFFMIIVCIKFHDYTTDRKEKRGT